MRRRDFITLLMGCAPNLAEGYCSAGILVWKSLNGDMPAELPVEQVTKIEFILDLKIAKVPGLTFSLPQVGCADEVIA